MAARCCATSDCCCAMSRPARGADADAVLIDLQDARRRVDIAARDAQAVLRGENLEVGVDHRRDGGEHDHLAVEAARDRGEFGRAQRRAVLAPEVDLVARVEHRAEACCSRSPCRCRSAVAEPSKPITGNSGAPAMRVCASACSMRATAAAMSRLARCARSTSAVSSRERKPRHQSGDGSAACGLTAAARYFGGTATSGPGTVSVVRQPDSSERQRERERAAHGAALRPSPVRPIGVTASGCSRFSARLRCRAATASRTVSRVLRATSQPQRSR